MADSNVPVTPGTGANVDTRTTAGGEHRQVVAVGTDGDNLAHVEAWGQLHVTQGAGTLFYDDFSSAVSADLWTTTVGTGPAVTNGRLVPAATVSSYNFTRSQDVMPNGVGYIDVRMGVQLETTAAVGAGRFWGLGSQATTPSATSLVQHGAGFEVDQATGNLLAVTYNSGVRTTIATLTRPTDGQLHRYSVCHRATQTLWFIDGYTITAASVQFADVIMADLYVVVVRQNAATFTGTPVFTLTAAFAADTNRDGTMIADSVVPARRARVSQGGAILVDRSAPETVGVSNGNIFNARAAITTATTVALQAAPAAGLSLYITDVSVSNAGATLCTVSLLPTSGTAVLDITAAASGGGGSMNLQTPIKLAAATGLSVTTSAASTTVYVTATGYYGP